MSDNWVVQNLENALEVWNDKLSEIWQLITQSPQTFKGGSIWSVICSIHGALQAIGYALLVLFFVVGVVKTCGSFAELKKPEHAVKLFVRFAIAKGLITYGMELMMAILEIIQGVVSTIMNSAGFGSPQATVLPQEIITAVEDCGFFESIPLWAVTLIGGLFIWVLSFVMILSVYGRFFKMYMYRTCAGSSFGLCRRTYAEHRQELHEKLCVGMPGGCNHRLGLHHLLGVCLQPSCCRSECSSGFYGVELHRRADFQHAHSGRRGENGRPACEGDDGHLRWQSVY